MSDYVDNDVRIENVGCWNERIYSRFCDHDTTSGCDGFIYAPGSYWDGEECACDCHYWSEIATIQDVIDWHTANRPRDYH